MKGSPLLRWGLGALAAVAVLGLLRAKPWQRGPAAAPPAAGTAERQTLAVGFLPVTCHLTCPVTDFATRTSRLDAFRVAALHGLSRPWSRP